MRLSPRIFYAARKHPIPSIRVSDEVRQALSDSMPVVSLELTIITHGLPFPQNVDMARRVESEIRKNGGVPATCAFLNGIPYVGLGDDQMQILAEAENPIKVSRRDVGHTMAGRHTGGTTIALTMILSHAAGIQVFATGGLGGVHKEGNITMDVSADLTELGRTPVTVVCAGPKSILDIGMTMEYLETQGVFVSTYNDDGRKRVQIPGFYTRESGISSPYSFTDFEEIAATINYQNNVMGLSSGNVICVPPPKDVAMSSEWINEIIERANETAKIQGVRGKELTPFLLSSIAKATDNKSVTCNVDFVINNAGKATILARHLLNQVKLSNEDDFAPSSSRSGSFRSSSSTISSSSDSTSGSSSDSDSDSSSGSNSASSSLSSPSASPSGSGSVVDTLVVGSLALDTISVLKSTTKLKDSNIGSTRWSVGGVGHNVALACHYAGGSVRLVSAVGNDFAGNSLVERMAVENSLCKLDASTALYTSLHDHKGDLIVASADMNIIEADWTKHIMLQIDQAQPKVVIMDCNLAENCISQVMAHIDTCSDAKVVIEPTSIAKASRLGSLHSSCLRVFPQNIIKMVTPTASELGQIYDSFARKELFDDYDDWFPVLDSLGITSSFREKLASNKTLAPFLSLGILQQAFSLLPYLERILIKLGSQGVLEVAISSDVSAYKSIPTTSQYSPHCIVTSDGHKIGESHMGVVIQYFPIPTENENITIKNVTGAGDTFLGVLMAAEPTWLQPELTSVEQEWDKWHQIYIAQLASGLTLQTDSSVSTEIEKWKK